MVNQIAIPSTGAGASVSPQPVTNPYATGQPKEGPLSAIMFLTIAAGQTTGILRTNISQYGMSMVQSLLVDNEANGIGATIKAGSIGLNFGIPPNASQLIPVFQTGVLLEIDVALESAPLAAVSLAFQIFNTFIPPASWFSTMSVNGNMTIESVSGNVAVEVQNAELIGVGIAAEVTGGANGKIFGALTNSVQTVKSTAGQGTFKGFSGLSTSAGWIQLFDAPTSGAVVLGTTVPTWAFPLPAATPVNAILPPEGLAFVTGLQIAWTTTYNGALAPANPFQGTVFYA
jgi:hypothetical protein